jgi:putative peptidoglycan lipid II flippase
MIKSTWAVSLLTMLSRILGLVRDKALVLVFGASGILDAFFLAFTIPNLFRRLFGEGALSSAFIPVFIDYRENRSPSVANRFANIVLTALMLFLTSITAIIILLALGGRQMLPVDDNTSLALKLTATMIPFMPLICVSALLSGMLQSVRIFAIPAAMPVLLNIFIIGTLGYTHYNATDIPQTTAIFYVAAAVVGAGIIQFLVQIPVLWSKGVWIRPSFSLKHEGLNKVLKAMGPTVLGLAVFQINVLLDRLIAYILVGNEGALTHLYLGNRLMQLPLALFGISLATTAFPEIVSHMKREDWKPLFEKISAGIRFLAFLMLPATFGLIALAEPVIRMIFQEPDLVFTDASVYKTSLVLALYAPGLLFVSLQQLFTRIFYAEGDYKTPVSISVKMVFLNLILNVILIHAPDLYIHWATAGNPIVPLGEGGLALSTSITALITAYLLWSTIKERLNKGQAKDLWEEEFSKLKESLTNIVIASAIMGILTWLIARSIPAEPEFWVRLERGIVPVVCGIFSYIIICYSIPVPEIEEFVFKKTEKKK